MQNAWRMNEWRHAEAVLSVCVHLSAPYIFWVGWIAVRENLCGLLVWLTDVKAKAALTIAAVAWACSVFLSKACCAPSWSSQHEGHPNCLVSSSPFVLDWCVHVYVLPYLCVCVFIWGFDVCPVFPLPTLEQRPAGPPISALIWMLLGRKRKSGIAGSCKAVMNLEMISALPKAWASNQCNMLELILLPSLLSWLVS